MKRFSPDLMTRISFSLRIKSLTFFVESGGTLIATSMLPEHSSEPGRDDEVKVLINELFGTNAIPFQKMHKTVGMGHCYALPCGDYEEMRDILHGMGLLPLTCPVEGIAAAHRRRENGDIWYIVNRNGTDIELELRLETERPLKLYDPYIDTEKEPDAKTDSGFSYLKVTVPADRSLFLVEE